MKHEVDLDSKIKVIPDTNLELDERLTKLEEIVTSIVKAMEAAQHE